MGQCGLGTGSLGTVERSPGTVPKSLGTAPESIGTVPKSLGTAPEGLGTVNISLGTVPGSLGTVQKNCVSVLEGLGTLLNAQLEAKGPVRTIKLRKVHYIKITNWRLILLKRIRNIFRNFIRRIEICGY